MPLRFRLYEGMYQPEHQTKEEERLKPKDYILCDWVYVSEIMVPTRKKTTLSKSWSHRVNMAL